MLRFHDNDQGRRRRISVKKELSNDSTLIQTNIFDAFKKLTALSTKQQRMKLQKKNQCSSPLVMVISDESDSENEVTTKASIGTIVDGTLPFFFEDDSDEDGYPPKPESSLKGNVDEMMVLNKPVAYSTPLRQSPTSFVNRKTTSDDSDTTIKMDSSLDETFDNTTPNINLNSADASTHIEEDPDSTIIMENSLERRIFIRQDILITPKTSGNATDMLTNSQIPNKASTSTIREDIERVVSKNQNIVNIACRSTSTTDNSSHDSLPNISKENLGKQKIYSAKPEGVATKPSKKHKKKSDTECQNTLKSSCSDNAVIVGSGTTPQAETKNTSSQDGESDSNNNSSSSSNVLQTPTKCKISNPCGSTPSKEKCGESSSTPTSIDSGKNGDNPHVNHHKEVNSILSSITPRTPTKRKPSDSPTTSPSKRANETPSPKKEERKMNKNYLKVFEELFLSVKESPYLRNLIEEETPVLNLIISSEPKYFYVILELFTWLPKRYNIFRFCEKILPGMEEKEVIKIYTFLQEKGIVDVDFSKEDIGELLRDLDRAAVKRICDRFKLKTKSSGKNEMIEALMKLSRTQSTLTFKKSTRELILDQVLLKMGKCVKLKNHIQDAFYKTFLLRTFTNSSFTTMQDFFKSILFDKTVFPDYKIENYCVFYTSEEFSRYATARKFKDGLDKAMRNRNHIEVFQISENVYTALSNIRNENTGDRYKTVPHLERFTARSVYISILSKACDYLKTKYPSDAKKWIEYLIRTSPFSHRLGNWYYQLTWLYMRYLQPIDYVQSAELLTDILLKKREYLSDVQLQMLGERGEQLKRGTKQHKIDQGHHDIIAELIPEPIELEHFPQTTVDARAIRSNEIGKKRKYLVHVADGEKNYLSVENIALDYYTTRCGYTGGIHCEGRLIKASFTLFFWDLIYNPEKLVPGTFLSKYQEMPLDMMTTFFYTNRKEAIDKRLRDISSEWSDSKTIEFVKSSFDMHSHESGLCEPGVYIKDAEMLEILVNCIGRKVLAKIYERLVKNVGQYMSGMPDLFLWNIEEKKSKFVEVKGENDKLSVEQNLWLKYLQSSGAHIEVCIVHSIGSKRMQKVKLASLVEEKEQAASSISSSSGSKTPKNKNRKPKSKSEASHEKKSRTSEKNKEDNRASTSSKIVRKDSDSGSDSSRIPKNKNRKPKLNSEATREKKPRTSEKKKEDNRESTSSKTVRKDSDSGSD